MDRLQLIIISISITLIIIITAYVSPQISINNLLIVNYERLFFPFGVIFFALTGYSVMPELEQILLNHEKAFKQSVLTAMITCTIIYLVFNLIFIGVYGNNVSEVATNSLPGIIGIIGIIIAVFCMTTPFMGLGVALSDVFKRDLKLSNNKSWALTCLIPLTIAVLFKPSFIQPILISGAYTGTLTGLIIVYLWFKARKAEGEKPAFKAPLGMAGAITVSIVLITGLVMTTLELFGLI